MEIENQNNQNKDAAVSPPSLALPLSQDEAAMWKDRSIRLLADFARNLVLQPGCFPKTRNIMDRARDRALTDDEITELVQQYSNERLEV